MKFLKLAILPFICQFSYSESALQPPTIEYDYCNEKGTYCSKSEIEYYIEDGKTIAAAGGVADSNANRLLNLDHFYRNECMTKIGLNVFGSVPKTLQSEFSSCLVTKLSNAIENRNKENLDYLNRIKIIDK